MTDYDWGEACDLVSELEKYCTFEENSHGEMVRALLNLAQHPDYMSQVLWEAVVAGMKEELQNYKNNAQIVTTTETYTREYVDLVWNDEL